MADFKKAYNITMSHEGGYSNNPNDNGGETWKGIARKFHPNWAGWAIIDSYKNKPNFPESLKSDSVLDGHVLAFYKKEFWDVNKLDFINDQDVCNELFDTGVNMGVVVAAKFLQEALNLTNRNGVDYKELSVDGIIGNTTIAVTNSHKRIRNIYNTINILQGMRYIEICRKNPTQETFFNGWITRIEIKK